jgi:integrase
MTVQSRINQLGRAMRVLAPDQDWGWVQRAAGRLRAVAKPVRDKRGRLQTASALAELGIGMMKRAHAADAHFATQRAVLFRDGLIIALMAHRPLRVRTFAAVEIGKQLIQRNGCWWLVFGPTDTKTKTALEMPWPAQLVAHLEDYLGLYRPALMDRPGQRGKAPTSGLWVTKGGKMMGKAAIQHQIVDHTRRTFGKAISPHLFRDAAATNVAVDAPASVHVVPDILSHTSLKTSQRHYNQAGSFEAGGRYQSFLKQTRKLHVSGDRRNWTPRR